MDRPPGCGHCGLGQCPQPGQACERSQCPIERLAAILVSESDQPPPLVTVMKAEPLELLLDKWRAGDRTAAEQVFLLYEPYLRMVVRRALPRRLRAKFDSVDVVQSVWVHLLRGLEHSGREFADSAHLQAFLVRVARNRLTDGVRRHRRALEREQLLADGESQAAQAPGPRPSEIIQADELWNRMLALCSPEHREVLALRRQGLRRTEIAARTGLHEGSVRRILRELARRLACADPN